MKWLISKNKNQIYRKLRSSIFILVFIIIAASSILFYDASLRTVLDNAYHVDVQMLNTHKSASLVMQKLALNITRQIYNDNQIAYLLYGTEYNPQELMTSVVHLNNYRMSIPYIDSIYIYNGGLKSISVSSVSAGGYNIPLFGDENTKDLFFDREIADIINDSEGKYNRYAPIARRIVYPEENKEPQFCYTFMMTNVFGVGSIRHAVFVNFSSGWMQQMAKEGENSQSRTLIMDEQGIIVFSPEEGELFSNVSQEPFYRRIVSGADSDNFIQHMNGQEMMVTCLPSDVSGWRYVRLTPYRSVVEEIYRVTRFILTMAGILAALGTIATLVLSKILYIPIGAVNERMNALSRQHLMRKALLGTADMDSLISLKGAQGQPLALSSATVYYVLLLKADRCREFPHPFDPEKTAGFQQAFMDMAEEVFAGTFMVDAVDMGENVSIALILYANGDIPADRTYWTEAVTRLKQAAAKRLELSFSCAVSTPIYSPEDLAQTYRQVREALRYRIFTGRGSLIFLADVQTYSDREYAYPASKENHMVDCIMSGNAKDAKETVTEILKEIHEYSFLVIGLTVSRLAMSLSLLVKEMQKGGFLEMPPSVNAHILAAASLDETDNFQDTVERFLQAIDVICGSLENKRDNKHTDLLQRINALIEEQYSDPSCCLNSIAEKINMSPAYLGRLYKHYTLKGVSEQINAVRLEHARRLLREDKRLSVLEVSRLVGFTSDSYFSKAFRKAHGMTPNEYRNYASLEEP